jgi:hypothetical protein
MEYKTITVNVTTGETTESVVPMTANEVAYDKDAVQAYVDAHAYIAKRAAEYPSITDYIDGVVKGDQAQIQAYIDACLAVKQKYPKGVA